MTTVGPTATAVADLVRDTRVRELPEAAPFRLSVRGRRATDIANGRLPGGDSPSPRSN
jgi:hypothetical protein